MGGELGGVHADDRAVRVGEAGHLGHRHDLAGHVAGAGDGHHRDAASGCSQRCLHGLEKDGPRPRRGKVFDRPEPPPWKHVGVVLHLGAQDGGAGGHAQASGQVVDRVRGVADKDD